MYKLSPIVNEQAQVDIVLWTTQMFWNSRSSNSLVLWLNPLQSFLPQAPYLCNISVVSTPLSGKLLQQYLTLVWHPQKIHIKYIYEQKYMDLKKFAQKCYLVIPFPWIFSSPVTRIHEITANIISAKSIWNKIWKK